MRKLASALVLTFIALPVLAEDTCDAQATEKRLSGAAKTSFLKKCNANAASAGPQAACDADATEKKLSGAAKTSFTKKCVREATAASAPASASN